MDAEKIDRDSWMASMRAAIRKCASSERFLAAVAARLEVGAAEYGNESFAREPEDIVREILDETLDRAGWCYVLERACQARIARGDLTPKRKQRLKSIAGMALTCALEAFHAFEDDEERLETIYPGATLDR